MKATYVHGVDHFVGIVGAGTAQPTKTEGAAITLNRTGVGIIDVSWSGNPGTYMGVKGRCFESTTIAALKGYSVVAGTYDVTNRKITLNITDASDTLADLAATQRLSITFAFKNAPAS